MTEASLVGESPGPVCESPVQRGWTGLWLDRTDVWGRTGIWAMRFPGLCGCLGPHGCLGLYAFWGYAGAWG